LAAPLSLLAIGTVRARHLCTSRNGLLVVAIAFHSLPPSGVADLSTGFFLISCDFLMSCDANSPPRS